MFARSPNGQGGTGIRSRLLLLAVGGAVAAVAIVALALNQSSDSSRTAASLPEAGEEVELVARKLRPSPNNAFTDRAKIFNDGCYLKIGEVKHGPCAYGKRKSPTTVVLFGDSHGEAYFPALERLAKRDKHGFRFVSLVKNFCPPAIIELLHPKRSGPFTDCNKWRRETIRRILNREEPALVVVAGSAHVKPVRNGRELKGKRATRTLIRGYAEILRRVGKGGAEVALATDVAKSPFKIPECVKENRNRLRACNFRGPKFGPEGLARRSARKADADLVNTYRAVCRKRTCRGVVDDFIAYRDRGHLTATFGRTLAPKFRNQLPVIGP